ncbi:WXG100-like domain-containing protein [Nocardia pneumoniae]|uniref:WXG100-like domain-containing protein n=1 Tax=Nocardia pneumoniae TaxID=228601 RepID=UPI000592EC42|nr:hypothetical protein [Nocardia pneumoniae]
MTLEIPHEVRPLVEVVGGPWPESDEDAMRRLGAAWIETGDALIAVSQLTGAARGAALAAISGETAKALAEHGVDLDGDLQMAAKNCYSIGEQCYRSALDAEFCKYVIICSLVVLAAELAFAAFLPGVGQLRAAAATAETRAAVWAAVRALITKLGRHSVVLGAMAGALEGALIPVVAASWQMGERHRQWGITTGTTSR